MVTSLIDHERIKTTLPKAKELKRLADQMVTYAKKNTLESRRAAAAFVRSDSAVSKLFETLGVRYRCVCSVSVASWFCVVGVW